VEQGGVLIVPHCNPELRQFLLESRRLEIVAVGRKEVEHLEGNVLEAVVVFLLIDVNRA